MSRLTGRFVFVGERRSPTAIWKGVTWADRRLCAKTLCHVLDTLGLPSENARFINMYRDDGSCDTHALRRVQALQAEGWIVIGLGRTVQQALARAAVPHRAMIHPAARGHIRHRELYRAHVAAVLFAVQAEID